MNSRPWDVAVVGASSLIGEALREELRNSDLPIGRIHALEDVREFGREGAAGEGEEGLLEASGFDFGRVRIAYFCGRSQQARALAPVAAGQTLVLDLSGAFRESPEVPLVAADVNPRQLARLGAEGAPIPKGLIALPGSAVVALATALAPLHAAARLVRADVATYHSVSGAGRGALEELAREAAALLNGQEPRLRDGATRLAFNVLPQVDAEGAGGSTLEELRLQSEVARLLEVPGLAVNATAVRVPVFFGHAMAAHLQFERDLDPAEALRLLQQAPGVSVGGPRSHPGFVTPAEAPAADRVHVGRVRRDGTRPASLNLWIVADNVRKCAAINATSTTHILVNRYC